MEINLTSPYEIIAVTRDVIAAFYEKRENALKLALDYCNEYDEYTFKTLRDGTLLKNKMKETIIKGTERNEL